MFNVSSRIKVSFRERLDALNSVANVVKDCSRCSLFTERTNALAGQFVEPTDGLVVDMMPMTIEDKEGKLLAGDRDKKFAKLFSLVNPSLDVNKLSFTTLFKCFGTKDHDDSCLTYIDAQIRALDPVLIIALGDDVLSLMAGETLEMGKAYITGTNGQYLLFGLMHPRIAVKDMDKAMPVFRQHLASIASISSKYDLKIFR